MRRVLFVLVLLCVVAGNSQVILAGTGWHGVPLRAVETEPLASSTSSTTDRATEPSEWFVGLLLSVFAIRIA